MPSALRRQAARVRDPPAHPVAERLVALQPLRRDEDPALHLPFAHVGPARVRARERVVGPVGADTHHQVRAAHADGHAAAEKKGEPAEHPLPPPAGLAGEPVADAAGERLVVRHRPGMLRPERRAHAARAVPMRNRTRSPSIAASSTLSSRNPATSSPTYTVAPPSWTVWSLSCGPEASVISSGVPEAVGSPAEIRSPGSGSRPESAASWRAASAALSVRLSTLLAPSEVGFKSGYPSGCAPNRLVWGPRRAASGRIAPVQWGLRPATPRLYGYLQRAPDRERLI